MKDMINLIGKVIKFLTRVFGSKGEGTYENYWLFRNRSFGSCLYFYGSEFYLSVYLKNKSVFQWKGRQY